MYLPVIYLPILLALMSPDYIINIFHTLFFQHLNTILKHNVLVLNLCYQLPISESDEEVH